MCGYISNDMRYGANPTMEENSPKLWSLFDRNHGYNGPLASFRGTSRGKCWSVYYTLQTNVYKVVPPSYKLVYKP